MTAERSVLLREHLPRLFEALRADGFTIVGPTVREGAIVLDELDGPESLPVGWTEVQEAGRYRLERRKDEALFGYSLGPHSPKKYFHAARQKLFGARREGSTVKVETPDEKPPRLALLGVRACELAAIAIQDKVLTGSGTGGGGAGAAGDGPPRNVDAFYAARRRDAFFVAVNCTQSGGTCFCVSMGTGPRATSGFDLALTEVLGGRHHFVVEAGSERGRALLARLPREEATEEQVRRADERVAECARHQGRSMDASDVRELLLRNLEHPRWEDVAKRCLACANCTMVCPTCFCTTVEDVNDLTGDHAERWRLWDSCFNLDFTHLHGAGPVRPTIRSRYRQWLTHKVATWHDQFGTSGCVGCGRCITWCPVGIDLTEEVAAIRASQKEAP